MTCDDDATAACPAELKEIAAATTAETAFPAKDDDDDDCSYSVVVVSKSSSSFEKNPALTQLFFVRLLFLFGPFRRLPATNFADAPAPLLDSNNAFGAAIIDTCVYLQSVVLLLKRFLREFELKKKIIFDNLLKP